MGDYLTVPAVEFRVLGPVDLRVGDRVIAVERPQLRLLVAVLALEAGRPVSVPTLIDRLWDEPSDRAQNTLHVLLSQLRRLLGEAASTGEGVRLVRRGGGYVLEADPDRVDALWLLHLATQARQADGDPDRLLPLREAMGLWRGEPLSGLGGQWADRTRQMLRQRYLDAALQWARAELQAGDPATVVGAMSALAGEHPMAEPVTELLMRALASTGRPAEALTWYATTRRRLADELGTDPGPALQAVHQQILRSQLGPPAAADHLPTRAPPRQLPATAQFTGRVAELDELTTLLDRRVGGAATATVTISGTAGVGKTTLAVHWAHRVAAHFPDGQLYANMRGFDPTSQPVEPAAAIRGFLNALGVPPQRIPTELDALTALYRSELAGRRVLVLVDNVRDATQARPLLPGTPGCLVLVTSRNRLSGLVARDGAYPMSLDLFTHTDAYEFLAHRLGRDRVAAEPDAVEQLIAHCARLPLALSIVAARAATHPHLPLPALASELHDEDNRLQALATDDPTADIQAVFSWSYRALTPGAARLFRYLGLHTGRDLTAAAAASLAGLTPPRVPPLLAELTAAHLLIEHSPGRYALHDLLHAYAAHLTHTIDTDRQRQAATHRVLDHYLHSAYAADRVLAPGRDTIPLAAAQPATTPEQFADPEQARSWLTAEHPVLMASVAAAAATGFDSHAWQLVWSLNDFLDRAGHWHDRVAASRAAIAAAERLADPTAAARSHRNLAAAHTRLGQFDEAHVQLRHALRLTAQTDDHTGQAHTHISLAYLCESQNRHPEALHHGQQALHLYRSTGHRPGQARALNTIGWQHAQLHDHHAALDACHQALALHQELDDRSGQAATWDSIGYAHHHLGHHDQAVACYQRALDLFRGLGDRFYEADTLARVGDTHHTAGDHPAARQAWQHALTILDQLHHPNAQHVRAKLHAVSAASINSNVFENVNQSS